MMRSRRHCPRPMSSGTRRGGVPPYRGGAMTILTQSIRAAYRGTFGLAPGLLRCQRLRLIVSDLGRLQD
jgi:hypothetical protein